MLRREAAGPIDPLGAASPRARRRFVKTSLGAGFAAAVLPVVVEATIHTSARGIDSGGAGIPVRGGTMPAYWAKPAGKTGLPVVLVVQEIFGVHEHIKDVTRRLAKLGYLAVAPELYARQGDPSTVTEVAALIKDIVAKVPDAQVMADLDATAAWAAKNGGGGKLGITGFCWGGRIVWMYAAHNKNVAAGVAWYGPVVRGYYPGDKSPIELAGQIKAPILGLYGAADGGIPNDTVEKMREALKASGNTASEILLYPDTPHAFHADYRPSYRKEQAEDGWKRLSSWFHRYLG